MSEVIVNDDPLSRVATNLALIAGAISTLAEAVNGTYKGKPIYAQDGAAPPSEPPKRGRGRPVKGEETAAAVPAQTAAQPAEATTAVPASVEADPFAAPAPAAPTATLDEVRKALTTLKGVTSQEHALSILKKAGGADNLSGLAQDKYGVVVAAVNVELRIAEAAKTPAPDPFEVPASTAAVKPLTLEDVKEAALGAQKRTSVDSVQKVIMEYGGKASVAGGGTQPSLKALPEAQYAAAIAALKALPTTK